MNSWTTRPAEEQRLLNPCFCSLLLWNSACAHEMATREKTGIPLEECFLVLPMILHGETRESLPTIITTSLPVWRSRNPLAASAIANRARALVPFTKEALLFGGTHGALQFKQAAVFANFDWKQKMSKALEDSSEEVCGCAKRAEFLGRWFAKTGSIETVFSLLGVKP